MTIGCSAFSDVAVHGRHRNLIRWNVEIGLANKWSTILKVTNVRQPHNSGRDVEPEIGAKRASVARENAGEPAPQERQDVEMLVDAPAESASVKRGSDAVADNEERARLRLRADARNMICKTCWNPRPRRGPRWSRGGVRSVKAHNFSTNWRKRARPQFKEARVRVLMFLLILLWLRA